MFGFFNMMDNYEDRKVANDEINGAVIDTVSVSDSEQPYETGVKHESYNKGAWVIVEMYDSEEEAEIGHSKWVDTFRKGLPETLTDVGTSDIKQFIGVDKTFVKNKD